MSLASIADTEAASNPERAGFIFKADWLDPFLDAAYSITFADAGQWDVFMDYPRDFPRWNGCDALRLNLCCTRCCSKLIDHIDTTSVPRAINAMLCSATRSYIVNHLQTFSSVRPCDSARG